MKFLIVFMVSLNLFSVDFYEAKSSVEEIQTSLQQGTVSETEGDRLKNKILDILKILTQETNYWDKELEGFIENTLNYLADLLLAEGVAYSSETITQMMEVLDGYLAFVTTPTHPHVVVRLMERIVAAAIGTEQQDPLITLRRLLQRHNRNDLRRILSEIQVQVIRDQLQLRLQETLPFLTQIVEQLIDLQAEVEAFPGLAAPIEGFIIAVMRAAEPLVTTERNVLANMIRTRLRLRFWLQLNIVWEQFTPPSAAMFSLAASNVRMMR